jgi:Domain of unknown function (DUF2017)
MPAARRTVEVAARRGRRPTFEPVEPDGIRANLSEDDLELLRSLPAQLRKVLESAERDPANDRLFPPAYLDVEDIESEEEFQRLAHDDLVNAKLEAVDLVVKSLERAEAEQGRPLGGRRWTVELSGEETAAWLGVLNDVRLTLGVRLEITEDFTGDIDERDPRAPALHLLDYLGWLEEHLLMAITAGSDAG